MNTKYLTRKGYEKIKKELGYLWRTERPETTKVVTWAASLGDRSENADYQYNKRKLRQIDSRIRYLRKTLEASKIVDYDPQQEGRIFFGAWVKVEDLTGKTLSFRIVGAEEIYGEENYISLNSPMAQACLKKQVDDEFIVNTPDGKNEWLVLDISYEREAT